ncbi:hypothetical protein JCM15519_06240 [Fundidesulfovibrio butyratiphilus]
MSKKEFVLKGRTEADGMTALLEDVLKCFKAGFICLSNGQEYLTLKPAESVDFVIEGQTKKGRQKLVLEMSWTEGETLQTPPNFSITSQEPEIAPEAPASDQAALAGEAPEQAAAEKRNPAPFEAPGGPCDFIGAVAPVEEKKEKPEKKGKKE